MDSNTGEDILAAARELLQKMIEANKVVKEDVCCIMFTTTSDLNAAFPAAAARQLGLSETALLGGQEINVPGSLPMCLRIMMLVNTERRAEEIVHVYIKGTENLKAEPSGS